MSTVIPIVSHTLRAACSSCSLQELCLPAGLAHDELERLDQIVNKKRPLKRGDYLYRAGGSLQSLYAVRTGFFKSCVMHDDGREQVAGFHMAGELLGMDGIGSGKHMCDTVSLEDSEVCEIPFPRLEELFGTIPTLLHHFHRMMSREITREQNVMLLLGNMRAEQRFAAFLVNLASRYAARGYSSTEFQLRMSREEIGNYLGLTIETVSRTLTNLESTAAIALPSSRRIVLRNRTALRRLNA